MFNNPVPGMPAEPWMYACGFRTVIGMLLSLKLPKRPVDTSKLTAAELAAALAPVNTSGLTDEEQAAALMAHENPHVGECKVLICAGVTVTVKVDEHTAIIGLKPSAMNGEEPPQPVFHSGELVQINLVARRNYALSIERYFTNVRHMANTNMS